MRKSSLYPKLAVQNIELNGQFYTPYIITCIATIAMFYIMAFLTFNEGTAALHSLLLVILRLGMVVIGLFSVIFIFYTNSFLMKRRQKELGLYNILGMGKGNIAGVLFFETIFVAMTTIIIGICMGILFSKLMMLLLCKLVRFSVPYGFNISIPGIYWTLGVFGFIFALILISNLIRIKLSNPIELLHGTNLGEKEPKVKWLLAILGLLTLGAGYYIAIVTDNPLSAIFLFFVAVILVIIGTYLLFTASSIAILKRLKANPKYYYQTRHFIPLSGMIYRMKQNAVGLANICILSTMVLVMVSGTVCLYLGTEDSLVSSYPNDIAIDVNAPTGNTRENITALVNQTVTSEGYTMENVQDYISISVAAIRDENNILLPEDNNFFDPRSTCIISLMSESEYERFSGQSVALSPGHMLLSLSKDSIGPQLSIGTKTNKAVFSISGEMKVVPKLASDAAITPIVDFFFAVITDEDYESLCAEYEVFVQKWQYGFDFQGSHDEKITLYKKLMNVAMSADSDSINGGFLSLSTSSRQENSTFIYEMNGGFLFLGMFLGSVFLMATVLIIYYKQLSEGYEDRERFEIMQKVGLSKPEIKKAIRSQILVVFFLPLGMAVIHIAAAFKMITQLLLVMGLSNSSLFLVCTIATVAVFALIYGIVYTLTAKTYYRVVE